MMAGEIEAVSSLSRYTIVDSIFTHDANQLVGALEGEERRIEDGAQSDPQRFVTQLLGAIRHLSNWPEARARLLARRDELQQRFAPGGRFGALREQLRSELAETTHVDHPEGTSEADASVTLEIWRAALGEEWADLFRSDPALAARELEEDFERWKFSPSARDALLEFLLELKEAAIENAVFPWRGVRMFLAPMTTLPWTLRGVEMRLSGEHECKPTVPELLATARWLIATASSAALSTRAKPVDEANDAKHSIDFASVDWYGTPYTFATNQAACVKVLWEAWKNKTPSLSGPEILDQANISQERLDKVFRDKRPDGTTQAHPAWKTMIVSSRKGRYCLQSPLSGKSPT